MRFWTIDPPTAFGTSDLTDFPTGIMCGRVHPANGQLYLAGLSAWATSQTEQEVGFYGVDHGSVQLPANTSPS